AGDVSPRVEEHRRRRARRLPQRRQILAHHAHHQGAAEDGGVSVHHAPPADRRDRLPRRGEGPQKAAARRRPRADRGRARQQGPRPPLPAAHRTLRAAHLPDRHGRHRCARPARGLQAPAEGTRVIRQGAARKTAAGGGQQDGRPRGGRPARQVQETLQVSRRPRDIVSHWRRTGPLEKRVVKTRGSVSGARKSVACCRRLTIFHSPFSSMSKEYRPLLMRANRLLGASLVEHNLVKIEDLETANEKLIEFVASDQPRQSTILGILAYDMKVLKEDDVLHHVVEAEGVGLVDLRDYEIPEDVKKQIDVGACWATWSVPFDREEEFSFVATAYYLSPAVRNHWEKQLGGPILWFGTTLEAIADFLEKHASADAPAAAAAQPAAVAAK